MQKLNSTMNSIKSFWSPELKRERQLRKEESSKLASLQRQIAMRNVVYFFIYIKEIFHEEFYFLIFF